MKKGRHSSYRFEDSLAELAEKFPEQTSRITKSIKSSTSLQKYLDAFQKLIAQYP